MASSPDRNIYKLFELDVYRKAVEVGTALYKQVGGASQFRQSAVAEELRQQTLAMVLNLAAGLGFWEPEWKSKHLTEAKAAALKTIGLVDVMVQTGGLAKDYGKDKAEALGVVVGGIDTELRKLVPPQEVAP